MNVEWSELAKTGQMQFSHPTWTNDDRIWALALAVYTSRTEIPEYHPCSIDGQGLEVESPKLGDVVAEKGAARGSTIYR